MDPRIPTAARLHQQKNYTAAENIYRQVLSEQPRNADALLLLGLLLNETGRHEPAVEMLRQSIALQPNRPETHQTLVGCLQFLGRLPEAIESARQVVRLKPTDPEAHFALAQLMLQSKNPAGALPHARRAAELSPRNVAILVCLSRTCARLEMRSEAMATVERALAINPNDADALIDRGQFLQAQGRLEEAIVSYGSGLKFSPKNLSALNNLGACLLLKAQPAQAIPYFQAAAAAMPTSPKPPNNIGAALKEVGQIDQAIVQFRRAIEIDPTYADAHCNLGGAYASLADHEAAIAAYRRTLEIDPAFAGVGSNLLLAMLSPADISAAQLLAEHKAWNDQHAMQLTRAAASHGSIHLVARRLRVGYVSPDFREHSVRYFIEPIFAAHDRSRFEVFAYATGRRRDAVSNLLAGLVEHWHPVAELNDAQLADLIRSHGIDILIDLAGHTSDNRLLSFARRPAPVQITYLGYPTTTGMPAIDFRITDAVCDPPGADGFYAEKLIRMPNAFFVYQDDSGKPFDPALPADRNGHFTFGSFNSFTKINDQTLTAWANILQAVSGSRLLMKARPVENPSTREKLLGFFTQRGIATDRIDLRAWVTLPEHFAMLAGGIDLMLDTFPYNGHTTSCQSIWMGVPMVTRSGDSFRSRVGETMLNQLNLMELVARDWNEYEKIAVKLASDWSTLRQLRPTLRDRMRKSTLCDAAGFTRTLESHFISALRQVPSPA